GSIGAGGRSRSWRSFSPACAAIGRRGRSAVSTGSRRRSTTRGAGSEDLRARDRGGNIARLGVSERVDRSLAANGKRVLRVRPSDLGGRDDEAETRGRAA